ncbi:MAG: hypothetical protein P4L27_00405 [Ignavibacteriaceae bacterium]|nr:hypothetical protein [Ignavibacteriaceae bacterium]
MNEEVVAVFIPIIFFIVTGLVMVTFFYFRSKEKQMLIEKGLSSEEIKTFYDKKKDPFILMKIGIICLFFGIGLGVGLMLQENTNQQFWVPFLLFVSTGLGFVLANIFGRSMLKKENVS